MPRESNNGFEEWGGYMDAKITKLEEQFSAASDPFRQTNLFAGISIFVNGLTNPSADELKRIMMVHGGTFHHYQRSFTTYIIASNLPDVKVRNMNTSKIISPQWVVDCVREKRILDYTRYLLYTNQKPTQPRLCFATKKNEETMTPVEASSAKAEEVSAIMNDLKELNAKMKDSLGRANDIDRKPSISILNESSSSGVGTTGAARTAVDPKFLSEFYNNSRLHHIATLGAGFKQYVSELRDTHGKKGFPAREKMKKKLLVSGIGSTDRKLNSCVMHIDMDCFFVSVGLRKFPHLRGQPVAVTHSKGGSSASEVPIHLGANRQVEMELFAHRFENHLHNNILSDKVRQGFDSKMSLSEIASCSYEARAKGLRNGMFVGQAIKMCPELKTIPYDFEGYREVAFKLYDTIAQYTLNIEAVSCDEMFVELSDVLNDLKVSPMAFVQAIREEVRRKTGCPCSAGVGANKLQARMATKRAKPDGQYYLIDKDVEVYMSEIPISDLPGVGSSTTHTLKEANLITCGDLQRISLARLQMLIGKKFGETLHQFCRGIDNRPLIYGQIRKSVSAEVNYGIRFKEYSELETFLRQLCTEVHTRLSDIKRKTKCITLKLMVRAKDAPLEASKFMGHGVCDNITKSVSLSEYTCDLDHITRTVLTTMKALSLPPNELRGIGIQLSKLDDPNEGKEQKENIIKNMFSKVVEKQQQVKKSEYFKPKVDQQQPDQSLEFTSLSEPDIKSENTLNEPKKSSPMKHPKRGRGRPSITSMKEPKKRANNNIMGMLQNAAAKKTAPTATITSSQCPPDVDPGVFSELPNDIRAEILREYALKNPQKSNTKVVESKPTISYELNESDLQPSTSKAAKAKLEEKQRKALVPQKLDVDEEFLQAMPPDIRAEIEMQLRKEQSKSVDQHEERYKPLTPPPSKAATKETSETTVTQRRNVSSDNIFAQTHCTQLLLAWVQSCDVPENYDIDLISSHVREFVRIKYIDKLYDPLMYLCRLINSQKSSNCAWHMAYKMIIEAVQKEMQTAYDGRKLFLGIRLRCDKC